MNNRAKFVCRKVQALEKSEKKVGKGHKVGAKPKEIRCINVHKTK